MTWESHGAKGREGDRMACVLLLKGELSLTGGCFYRHSKSDRLSDVLSIQAANITHLYNVYNENWVPDSR